MSTAATRSAIKRASQQARNAMQQLDKDTIAALQEIYSSAAEAVQDAIRARVDSTDTVPVGQLRELLHQIEDVIDRLAVERDQLLQQSLVEAATLGVRPYTAAGVAATGRAGQAVLDTGAAMRVHEVAVRFVQTFQAADGLSLSERIWRLDKGAKEALTRSIGQAVVSGWDAARAARSYMTSGQMVPFDVAQRLKFSKVDQLVNGADLLLGKGGEVWKAERVMRTEINRAHGTAYMAGAEKTPGFGGFRFLLSPMHPKPDICFRRGTLVTTRRGLVPIEGVVLGDEALTHLGRWRPVVKLYRSASGQNGLVRLRFQEAKNHSREVVLTPNHPVLTPRGWTPAGDLQTGSAVVCLATKAPWLHPPCAADAGRTALQGSGETASAAEAQTAALARCGAHALRHLGTVRSAVASWLRPNGLPMFGAAMHLLSCFLRAMLGCLPQFAGQKAISETVPSAETGRGGACQNSGWQRQAVARMPGSSISGFCCTRLAQMSLSTLSKSWVWLRGFCRNTRLCNTRWTAPLPSTAGPEIHSYSRGRWWGAECRASSIAPRKCDRKNALWLCAGHAPTVQGLVSAACRSVHMFFGLPWRYRIAFRTRHPIVDRLQATGEEVYNIEVEEDHSYIAAGMVVHNCDLLAEQNLYGLGAGVYPNAKACPWPAHPNTLSFVEMVFADEVSDADRAGKETVTDAMARMSPEVRQGILGVEKADLYDAGQVKPWMIRSPLYAVKQRLARTGKA